MCIDPVQAVAREPRGPAPEAPRAAHRLAPGSSTSGHYQLEGTQQPRRPCRFLPERRQGALRAPPELCPAKGQPQTSTGSSLLLPHAVGPFPLVTGIYSQYGTLGTTYAGRGQLGQVSWVGQQMSSPAP